MFFTKNKPSLWNGIKAFFVDFFWMADAVWLLSSLFLSLHFVVSVLFFLHFSLFHLFSSPVYLPCFAQLSTGTEPKY
jgi:hypothetical protein